MEIRYRHITLLSNLGYRLGLFFYLMGRIIKKNSLFLMVFSLICSGCASRKMVPYNVESIPSGAPVEVNGAYMGDTPTTITLGTVRHWVGVLNAPGGWAYGNETYEVKVYPPKNSTQTLRSQTKRIMPQMTPMGGNLLFDLRLENVLPTQPVTIEMK